MPNLCLEWMDETGQVSRLDLIDKIFIGRCCRGIEDSRRIVVKDLAVSRDHTIVSLDGSRFQITDMSKNGVLVNNVRVEPGSPRNLFEGDIITFGDATNLAFRLSGMANKSLTSPIIICEKTAGIVDPDLRMLDLGLSTIRGRSGEEHLFDFYHKTGL